MIHLSSTKYSKGVTPEICYTFHFIASSHFIFLAFYFSHPSLSYSRPSHRRAQFAAGNVGDVSEVEGAAKAEGGEALHQATHKVSAEG
jgi:hypothetical protein